MSLQKQPRSFYITAIVLLILIAASSYYLLAQDDEHYAVLVGRYTSGEIAEKDLPVFEVFSDVSEPGETERQPEKIVPEEIEEKPKDLRYGIFTYFPEEYTSQIKGRSFYTVQLTSSTGKNFALEEFDKIGADFPADIVRWLRVEHVQQYHTIRAGKFLTRQAAEPAYKVLAQIYPKAQILNVYIKPERISRIFMAQLDAVLPSQLPEAILSDIKKVEPLLESRLVDEEEAKSDQTGSAYLNDIPGETENQFFTIQLMSSSQLTPALREYDRVVKKMAHGDLDNLRVEQIKNYFTVRVGKFDSSQEAELLKKIYINIGYKDALLLSAYIIPSRIKKIFVSSVTLEEKKVGIDSDKDKVVVADLDIVGKTEVKTTPAAKPKEVQIVVPQPLAETPPVVEALPAKVTFSFEVLTILDKDDKGENLRMPSALFFDDATGELYVVNGSNNRIVVYGADYFPQNSLGKGRGVESPLSGALDKKGNVYITQAGTPSSPTRLTVLNAAFLPEREILLDGIPESDGFVFQKVAVAKNGLIYATGLKSGKVLVLEASGAFKKWLYVSVDKKKDYVFNDGTSEPEMTAEIKDVVIDSLGNLFLLSEEKSKVYVFSPDEKFLFSFGTKGGAPGKMSRPRGLVIDEKKRCFYLVDYMRHTVLVYDFTGAYRFEFGGRGWGPEWFNYPVDIELGPQGQVIVADFFNQRVQVFETHFSGPLPQKPQGLWTVADK